MSIDDNLSVVFLCGIDCAATSNNIVTDHFFSLPPLLFVLLFTETEINRVRSSLFQLNGSEKKPLKLPDPEGPNEMRQDKIYVPVDQHPDVRALSVLVMFHLCQVQRTTSAMKDSLVIVYLLPLNQVIVLTLLLLICFLVIFLLTHTYSTISSDEYLALVV